jgi:salicylate hydroxylase
MGSIEDKQAIEVAIIGGGIGGLSLAIGLQQYQHVRVKIYEATSKFAEIGGRYTLFSMLQSTFPH